jgi:mRNA-degrading endonuclease RelE of RelBE toxin-antitoxin system
MQLVKRILSESLFMDLSDLAKEHRKRKTKYIKEVTAQIGEIYFKYNLIIRKH